MPGPAEAEAERTKRLAERLERAPKGLDEGGGMWWYERAWFTVQGALGRARDAVKARAVAS